MQAGIIASPGTEIHNYLEHSCVSAGPWEPCYWRWHCWVYVARCWQGGVLQGSLPEEWQGLPCAGLSGSIWLQVPPRSGLCPSALRVPQEKRVLEGEILPSCEEGGEKVWETALWAPEWEHMEGRRLSRPSRDSPAAPWGTEVEEVFPCSHGWSVRGKERQRSTYGLIITTQALQLPRQR